MRKYLMLASLLFSCALAQQAPDMVSLSSEPIDLDAAPTVRMRLLDPELKAHSVFLIGEEHWIASNTRLQYRFLTYLYHHAKVRTLLLEGGFAYGWLINRYLETGEETHLIKAITKPATCPENLFQMFRQIYQFNRVWAKEDPIRVAGIDLERSPQQVLECLYFMLPDKQPNAAVRARIRSIKVRHVKESSDEDLRKFFRQFQKEILETPWGHQQFWGENYDLVVMMLNSLVESFDLPNLENIFNDRSADRRREEMLYQNFRRLHGKGLIRGNCMGQFGVIHTELAPSIDWGYPTLAQQLNESNGSPARGKVLTIAKYLRRQPMIYDNFKGYPWFFSEMDRLDRMHNADVLLVRLAEGRRELPRLQQNMPFVLLMDRDFEREPCK
ncbi:MAG: hypothetical protein AAF206_11035 [Bacteroidota bacterium]